MRYWNKRENIISVLYGIVALASVILLLFVSQTENAETFTVRNEQGQQTVENVAFQETEDASAPVGLLQTYCWVLPEQIEENCCLAFYTVHQYVEVYFDGELMYSLMPRKGNQIGQTIGSNWVFVPLYPQDASKEVRVEITPVYESTRGRTVTFYTGTHLQIYLNQLKKDLPQIVLSILAIVIGAAFSVISLYNRLKRGNRQGGELIYLGVFSVIIGLWKLSDTRLSPLMFPRNPLLLSDISLMTLMLAPVPLMLFVRSCSRGTANRMLDAACFASILSSAVMLVLQAANIMDFRESLSATHVIIVLTAAAITVNEVREWKKGNRSGKSRVMAGGFLMCTVGALLDLFLYYVRGNSASVLYTLTAFLVCVILTGAESSRELNYRAHIDMHTGLYNKSCCNEQFSGSETVQEPTAVFMFDLNGLKQVNDTMGHDTGDAMIFQFADILRKNLPARAFVGRYGGDEFIAILRPADGETIRKALDDVAGAVERYNGRDARVPISYAVGSASSADYPGEPMRTLLEKADTDMYEDKRLKHAAQENI